MDSSQSQLEQAEQMQQPDEHDLEELQRGDIREGTILSIDDHKGVLIDFGIDRQGLVPPHDLEKLSADRRNALQVGKTASVYITDTEKSRTHLSVSIHQAISNEKWIEAEKLKESGEIWEAKVTGYNQGGVIVPFGKLRGFVPISHLLDIPKRSNPSQIRERLGNYIGRTLPLARTTTPSVY
jgi:small subunit ribosomal protein S1